MWLVMLPWFSFFLSSSRKFAFESETILPAKPMMWTFLFRKNITNIESFCVLAFGLGWVSILPLFLKSSNRWKWKTKRKYRHFKRMKNPVYPRFVIMSADWERSEKDWKRKQRHKWTGSRLYIGRACHDCRPHNALVAFHQIIQRLTGCWLFSYKLLLSELSGGP